MATTSTCTSIGCMAVHEGQHKFCPTCGKRAMSSRTIRIAGWVQVACGVILIGIMLVVMNAMGPSLAQVGKSDADGSHFSGTAEQAVLIMRLFYAVLAFGVLALGMGTVQAVTGRRYRALLLLMIPAVGFLLFTVWQVTQALK